MRGRGGWSGGMTGGRQGSLAILFLRRCASTEKSTNAISCGPDMGPAELQDRKGNLLVMSPFVSLT